MPTPNHRHEALAEQFTSRLIRIETRLARIQAHLGLKTCMYDEDLTRLPYGDDATVGFRLSRIETKVCKLMEAMNLNPKTGQRNDDTTFAGR